MRARKRAFLIVGGFLVGLAFGAQLLRAVMAAMRGEAFVGENYWNQPLSAWGVIITFGAVAVIGVIWAFQRLTSKWRTPSLPGLLTVRIVGRPAGEAPEWVRDAWVGLELPLAAPRPIAIETVGVLSGRHPLTGGKSQRREGYVVLAARAVDVLAREQPEAAAWWRINAAELLGPDNCLQFETSVCEPVRPVAAP